MKKKKKNEEANVANENNNNVKEIMWKEIMKKWLENEMK